MRSLVTLSVVLFVLGCTPTGRGKAASLEVCVHIVHLMKRELASELVPLDPDLTEFPEHCVEEFEKEREKLGVERFDAQVRCVMAAEKLDDMRECDESDRQG